MNAIIIMDEWKDVAQHTKSSKEIAHVISTVDRMIRYSYTDLHIWALLEWLCNVFFIHKNKYFALLGCNLHYSRSSLYSTQYNTVQPCQGRWMSVKQSTILLLLFLIVAVALSGPTCVIVCHSTVQYSTMQYNTVQYSTVEYSTVQ